MTATLEQATSVVEYDEIEANLATLRAEFAGKVFDMTTTAGEKLAREVRAKFVKLRTTLEAIRQREKAPVLARGRALDAEASRIAAELLALEKPIDAQIKADERRRAEEAAEKARIERERVAALRRRIAQIQDAPRASIGAPAERIAVVIENLEALKVGDDFSELVDDAMAARATALEALRALHAQAVQAEATAKALAEAQEAAKRVAEAQAAREAQIAQEARLKRIQDAAAAAFEASATSAPPVVLHQSETRVTRVTREQAATIRGEVPEVARSAAPTPLARPVMSSPVQAPPPYPERPAPSSAWADQPDRPRQAVSRPIGDTQIVDARPFERVAVPKTLIERLLDASIEDTAATVDDWLAILNEFRVLIGRRPA